jgi:quercetin dioxygenase-like cupin family protein
MRSSVKQQVLAAFVGCLVAAGWSAYHIAAQRRIPITVTRLYTGADGQTHAGSVEVSMMPSSTIAGLEASETVRVSGAQFVRLPASQVRDWHPAESRQYVVPLSGRGEVELAGGQKVPLNPGQIIFVEDVTGHGHITRSTGSQDLVLLLIPFATQ